MLRVVRATGSRLVPALEILYSALPAEDRAARVAESAQAAAHGELDLSHLLLAEFNGSPVGALLLRLQPNETGLVWPPVVSPKVVEVAEAASTHPSPVAPEVIEDALLREAARQLDQAQAWIGQSLLELGQSRERAALSRNGFAHLTDLTFFERSVGQAFNLPDNEQAQSSDKMKTCLTYVPYRRARNGRRFANVIEQTYRGSLDCPEMNGLRSARQSLRSHESAGRFSPDMWRLYHRGGDDVGVLLMVDRPEQRAWEVIYLGVVETARRQGIAKAVLRDALQAARDAGVERLLIVVDARNLPAVRLYESLSFTVYDVRAAHVRLRD